MAENIPDPLRCTFEAGQDGAAVLRVVGDVDTLTASAFTEALADARARAVRDGLAHLVLDMGSAEFVSVAGMRSIVETSRDVAGAGVPVAVVGLTALQRSLIERIWPGTLRSGAPTAEAAGAAS